MSLRSKYVLISFLTVALSASLALAGDAKKGEDLYQANCSACHGDKGQGRGGPMGWFTGGGGEVTELIGNQLNSQNFLAMATDEYLKKSILDGRPGRPMPSWKGTLKDKDIEDIIAFMRTWQKPMTHPIRLSDAPVYGDPAAGKELFNAFCYECHGRKGEGTEFGPALNNQAFLGAASDDFIKQTVMRGRDGTIMLSFAKGDPSANVDLEEEQIEDIVAFIRTWDKKAKERLEPWLMRGK
jgi:mono/diheme cytochrome c family protein